MFSEKTAKILSIIGIGLLLGSAIIFVLLGSWQFSFILDEAKIGQFGDFVGGVIGSLFAFVGVILYYVALKAQHEDVRINKNALELQMKALNQQIEEFKAQTEELQETRKVYEEQTKLYREQTSYYQQQVIELKNQTQISHLKRFDSCFYNLLDVFVKIKKECTNDIKGILRNLRNHEYSNNMIDKCKEIISLYEELFYEKSTSLSRYFETIYRLIRLIETSKIEAEEKKQYAKILCSQLTSNDLSILYYSYFSDVVTNAKTFAITYNMLSNLTIFDKIELQIEMRDKRIQLLKYCNEISKVFDANLKRYMDIEGNDICITEDLPFLDIKSLYGLNISEDIFCFSMIYSLDIWKNQNTITIENNIQYLKMFIYDYFFLRKFKFPKDIIKVKKIEDENNITICFNVELKEI